MSDMEDGITNEIAEIQKHMSIVESDSSSGSVLDIIREKEAVINFEMLEARKQGENILAEARRKAVAVKDKADKDGPKEATKHFDTEIAKTQKEAEKIKATADAEVKAVDADGMKNFNKAVSVVEESVIP